MESSETIDNKFIILEKKGQGATADVFLVKDPTTQNVYAAKVLKQPDSFFDKEVEFLNAVKKLNNPYIVNIIDSGNGPIVRANKPTQTKQYLVLEYAPKCELFSYIYLTQSGFPELYSKVIFAKILKGIQAIHNAGICHRDLKMQNLLVDANYNPKICDFGFAAFNTGKLTEPLGTLNYAAPEILLKRPYDGFKADIFSLGVVLLTLITCKIGFKMATKSDPYYRLIMTKHYGQYWNVVKNEIKGVSEEFKKLFNRMVSFKPQDRPTIEDILLKDDWMKEIRDLSNEEMANLENKVREEFLGRESKVREGLKKEMEAKGQSDNENMSGMRSGHDDGKTYFDLSLQPKYAETGIGMNNYIKIKGNLEPAKFMNDFANKVAKQFGGNCIKESKNALKFNITLEEEEDDDDDDKEDEKKVKLSEEEEKEIEEELAKLELEDNDVDDNINKRECVIQAKLFQSINGNYLLRFVKKSGQLDYYYEKLDKVTDLVKKLL